MTEILLRIVRNAGVDMDRFRLADLNGGSIDSQTATSFRVVGLAAVAQFVGHDLQYNAFGQAVGGTITGMLLETDHGELSITGFALDPITANDWVANDRTETAYATILAGDDHAVGTEFADLIRTYAGNDLIEGHGGRDTIFAGLGDDAIWLDRLNAGQNPTPDPATASTYLRGEEGNDFVLGGNGFDDINGNQGDDTVRGGVGDDWVVGGKDNDTATGDPGADIVYGNLGEDTLDGGDGADLVRGGQGDDIVRGGAGADWLSGDRGSDTVTGGAGADIFHGSQDAGVDRVTDFSLADGDRIQLDPGTTYTIAQVGSDTVLDMGGGHQMILVGVTLNAHVQASIFVV